MNQSNIFRSIFLTAIVIIGVISGLGMLMLSEGSSIFFSESSTKRVMDEGQLSIWKLMHEVRTVESLDNFATSNENRLYVASSSDGMAFEIDSDDNLIVNPLEEMGWICDQVPWDTNKLIDWDQYDSVIIRSTWNYQENFLKFINVLKEINSLILDFFISLLMKFLAPWAPMAFLLKKQNILLVVHILLRRLLQK